MSRVFLQAGHRLQRPDWLAEVAGLEPCDDAPRVARMSEAKSGFYLQAWTDRVTRLDGLRGLGDTARLCSGVRHSASSRAFTPVFDGLWTRVNALWLIRATCYLRDPSASLRTDERLARRARRTPRTGGEP